MFKNSISGYKTILKAPKYIFSDDFDVTYYRVKSVDSGLNILELAKFTVLLQKETDTLHSDTQIHELRCELREVLV
jgi:hypothetical protein